MQPTNKNELVYEPSPASESAGAGDAGTDSDSPAPPPPSGLSMSDNLYYGSGSTCNNTQGNPSDFYANSENVTRQVAPGYPSSALSNLVANMPELRKAGLTEIDGSTKSFFSGAEAKPPQLPCEDYPFASTHFRVGIGDSVAVANLLIKFFEGENGDLIVKTHKWVLKGQFVLGSSVFDMKIKAFSTSNSEVVFEYMHRSGCRVSARKVFSDCVTALRANSPCKIECPCISSQVETATDAHGATTEPPKVPEPNSANDADAMLSLVSMVEETVLCAKGYKGECLMALWRVVGRQRIEPKTLLDARLGSAIMNSMKSADTRESYVAAGLLSSVIQILQRDAGDSMKTFIRSDILDAVFECFGRDDSSYVFLRQLSSALYTICSSADRYSSDDIRKLISKVNQINHEDSAIQSNIDMSRNALSHHMDVLVR